MRTATISLSVGNSSSLFSSNLRKRRPLKQGPRKAVFVIILRMLSVHLHIRKNGLFQCHHHLGIRCQWWLQVLVTEFVKNRSDGGNGDLLFCSVLYKCILWVVQVSVLFLKKVVGLCWVIKIGSSGLMLWLPMGSLLLSLSHPKSSTALVMLAPLSVVAPANPLSQRLPPHQVVSHTRLPERRSVENLLSKACPK